MTLAGLDALEMKDPRPAQSDTELKAEEYFPRGRDHNRSPKVGKPGGLEPVFGERAYRCTHSNRKGTRRHKAG